MLLRGYLATEKTDMASLQAPAMTASKPSWPGCGVPANEEEHLAATLDLQLIGKDPHPSLQRYVELMGAVLKVNFGSHNLQCYSPTAA